MSEKQQHSPQSPVEPTLGEKPSSKDVRHLEKALSRQAEADARNEEQLASEEAPAATRDPGEPLNKAGQAAPRVEADDEQDAPLKAVEAGLEAADDEQAEAGRQHNPNQ